MSNLVKKKEGFKGQRVIVIPSQILANKCSQNNIIANLYITDIGYYPKAQFHFRERPHGADQHILIYCHEGKGQAIIEKTQYKLESGEFITIPSKTPHTYAADQYNPWTIYWLHFKGEASDSIILQMEKKLGLKNFLRNNQKSIELFNEMYSQLERGYGIDNLMCANMALYYFLTTFLYNDRYSAAGEMNGKDAPDLAIDFLSSNVEKVLSLEDIASEVALSPSHFSWLFKERTGFSPIEYFNHLKVQKACQYLLFTKLRVKEISQELGIDDQYYFSRMFKKVMGTSPAEYREKRIH